MITRVFALSYLQMQTLVKEHPDALIKHRFISIVETPELRFLAEMAEREMTLSFADVDPESRYFSMAEEQEEQYVFFNDEHADKIIDFLVQAIAHPDSEMLFVNCMAGISRSGAIITFAASILDLPEFNMLEDNPDISPNPFVLKTLKRRWQERGLSIPTK